MASGVCCECILFMELGNWGGFKVTHIKAASVFSSDVEKIYKRIFFCKTATKTRKQCFGVLVV